MQQPEAPHPGAVTRITVPLAAQSVQGHRAGIVTRVLAASVDAVVGVLAVALGYAGAVAFYFVVDPRSFSVPDASFGAALRVLPRLPRLLPRLAWATTGRSYGARLLGLRVVNSQGGRVRPLIALSRALLCVFVPSCSSGR